METDKPRNFAEPRDEIWEEFKLKPGEKPVFDCTALTTRGMACQGKAMSGYKVCNFHLPGRAQAAGIAGCKSTTRYQKTRRLEAEAMLAGQRPYPDDEPEIVIDSADDVKKVIEKAINDVRKGHIAPNQAQMMAYLATTWLNADRLTKGLGGDERQPPEWKEVARSADPRATSEQFPGSDFGKEDEPESEKERADA